LFKKYDLPYTAGLTWTLNEREFLARAFVWGVHMEYYLHYYRAGPGLVFYEVCIRGDFAEVLAAVGYLVFVAALVYGLFLVLPIKVPA
jgi:hypothetical protein